MDSIFAQATATGRAGVSVIRLSGPQAFDIARILCKLPAVGRTGLRAVRGRDGALIDQALVLCFEQGASFTGERVVAENKPSSLQTNEWQVVLYFASCAFKEESHKDANKAKKLCHQLAPTSKYGKLTAE